MIKPVATEVDLDELERVLARSERTLDPLALVETRSLAALISEVRALRGAKAEWVKCSERMPTHLQTVFFALDGKVVYRGEFDDTGYWNHVAGYWPLRHVTHWMPRHIDPLPPPPEVSNG